MKKIFTLIAAVFVAMSVNAKEEISVSDFAPWDNCTIEGSTITMDANYKGGAIYLGRDMSEFDYVWIKFSNATGKPNFGVTYDDWQYNADWGPVFASTTVEMDGTGMVGIKLDKKTVIQHGNAEVDGEGIGDVYAQHVQQLTIQGGAAAASVTVEAIYFGTAAEFVEDGGDVPVRPEPGGSLVMFDTPTVYNGWTVSNVIPAKFFDVAEVGDVIYCTISNKAEGEGAFNAIFKIVENWSDYTELEEGKEVGEDYFKTTIPSEDVIDYLQKSGLRLQGIGFTLEKVELIVPEDDPIEDSIVLNSVKANSNAPVFNLAGQQVNKAVKGVYIQNGKKFVVK